jgi:hypothetical protein
LPWRLFDRRARYLPLSRSGEMSPGTGKVVEAEI